MDDSLQTYFSRHPLLFRLLLIGLALIVAVGKVVEVVGIFTSPTDENLFQDTPDGVRIVQVVPGGASDQAGIRVGDILIAINDQTFSNAREANRILKQTKPGDVINYTIRRNNTVLSLKVTIARVGIDWAILLSLFVMGATLTVGLFVGLLRPQFKGAQLFSLSLILLSPLFAITGVGKGGYGGILWWVALFLGVPLSLHAALYYPRPSSQLSSQWRFVQAAYLTGVVVGAVLIILQPAFLMFVAAIAAYGAGLSLLQRAILLRHDADTRRAQRWIWRAMLFLALSYPLGWVLFSLYGREFLYLLLLSVVVPVASFYSVTKYRFFGITRIMKRGLTYNIALAALIFLTSVLFLNLIAFLAGLDFEHHISVKFTPVSVKIFIDQNNPAGNKEGERFLYILFGAIMSVGFWLVMREGKLALDRWFHRQQYDYKRALTELSEIFAEKITTSELAESLCTDIMKYMQLKGVAIFLRHQSKYRVVSAKGSCEKLASRDAADLYSVGIELTLPSPLSELLLPSDPSLLKGLQDANVQLLVPLIIKNKQIGMILLAEKRSEEIYKEDDLHFIESLAKQAAVAFENARLNKEASDKRRLRRELEFAQKVQQELLPREIPTCTDLQIAATYLSAGEVGGDYYDLLYDNTDSSKPRYITALVGDVAGKGISAAMYMSRVQGIVRTLYQSGVTAPKDLLEKVNAVLFSRDLRRSFVTMICARFDTQEKTLSLVRAGHLPMIWYSSREHTVRVVKPSGIAIGLDHSERFANLLHTETIRYDDGDIFAFFSDGVTEAKNSADEEFGMERLMELIERHKSAAASDVLTSVEGALIDFVGNRDQFDDITLLIIKAVPMPASPEPKIDTRDSFVTEAENSPSNFTVHDH
jgi:sigma-B regulation protein RsbU (phosphoserine phosphatase)